MDRKTKKKLDRLKTTLQSAKQRLAGAKKQTDDPGEIGRLEQEISKLEAEIRQLSQGG